MKRTNLLRKSTNLLMSVLLAGSIIAVGANGTVAASISSNDVIIGSIVNAAEAQELTATGIITYLQNDAGNPAPVFLANADGTYTLAMYKGTMVNFGVTNLLATVGGTPMPLQTSAYAAFAPAGDGQGIVIAATEVGAEVIQFQNVVNGVPTGNVITVALNVVDAAGTAATPAPAASSQIATSAYSYADDHKIVSTDGMLELNLDGMTWNSSTTHKAPKIYYAADGVLTVELYQGQGVNIPTTSNLPGYILETFHNRGYVSITSMSRGVKGTETRQLTIYKNGAEAPEYANPTTQLPIRVITLGSKTSDGSRDISPTDHGAITLSK